METIIGAVVGVVLGWLGKWWSGRGTKRTLAELSRKVDLIEIALEPRGLRVQDVRDPLGRLTGVQIVPREGIRSDEAVGQPTAMQDEPPMPPVP
jgi:hypothetical protein